MTAVVPTVDGQQGNGQGTCPPALDLCSHGLLAYGALEFPPRFLNLHDALDRLHRNLCDTKRRVQFLGLLEGSMSLG